MAPLAIGLLALIAFIALFSGWTGDGQVSAVKDTLWVLLTSGPWALAWIVAAIGLGWPLQIWLTPSAEDKFSLQVGLGVAAMLTADAGLGAIGAFQWAGSIGAWALLGIGIALAITQVLITKPMDNSKPSKSVWLICAITPAIAILLLAACSAPGWLWASEFGGYDALSYHLQLPKEWLALGRIQPLPHNVYSYLPGYVEAAFYHIAVLTGEGVNSAYANQLLHAGLTLLTALVVGRTATRLGGTLAGIIAAVLLLGTPWIIVVGSLGYNEMAVALLFACGLSLLLQNPKITWREGAALGLLISAACGSKLTAIGFVAAPLIAIALINIPPKRWLGVFFSVGITSLFILLPYLLRNWIYSGNPIFPFAADLLGSAHWTAEQMQTFSNGHAPPESFGLRLSEMWHQLMRYGLGSNPYKDEPWRAQWSILPWLSIISLAILTAIKPWRKLALRLILAILIGILFWLSFTHIKSRFVLPIAVPAVLAISIAIALAAKHFKQYIGVSSTRLGLAIILLFWSIQTAFIFADEGGNAPAQQIEAIDVFTGDALTVSLRDELAKRSPIITVNHLLPDNAKVLFLGEATPFYYKANITYQTTWDRGPLSEIIRADPDQPTTWIAQLRELGFTHILINYVMIQRWEEAQWNDPLINTANMYSLTKQLAVQRHWNHLGITLYRLH